MRMTPSFCVVQKLKTCANPQASARIAADRAKPSAQPRGFHASLLRSQSLLRIYRPATTTPLAAAPRGGRATVASSIEEDEDGEDGETQHGGQHERRDGRRAHDHRERIGKFDNRASHRRHISHIEGQLTQRQRPAVAARTQKSANLNLCSAPNASSDNESDQRKRADVRAGLPPAGRWNGSRNGSGNG
uniref:Uncharacterized protein n=1 Tax=Plectus sambesii TaxID=2011161 RepID=A0A914WBP0_9BILA